MITSVTQKRAQAGLYINLKRIMSSGDIEEFILDGEQVETVRDVVFLGANIEDSGSCKGDILRRLALGRAAMTAKQLREEELTALSCGAGEDRYKYHGLQEEQTHQLLRKLKLPAH